MSQAALEERVATIDDHLSTVRSTYASRFATALSRGGVALEQLYREYACALLAPYALSNTTDTPQYISALRELADKKEAWHITDLATERLIAKHLKE